MCMCVYFKYQGKNINKYTTVACYGMRRLRVYGIVINRMIPFDNIYKRKRKKNEEGPSLEAVLLAIT